MKNICDQLHLKTSANNLLKDRSVEDLITVDVQKNIDWVYAKVVEALKMSISGYREIK